MATTEPVTDWTTDYDIFDPSFVADPYPVWTRAPTPCPVAHTGRWGGSWMPSRFEDVDAIAHDVEHFSSTEITVTPPVQVPDGGVKAPPITSDPPEHAWARRLILPAFAPRAVERYVRGDPGAVPGADRRVHRHRQGRRRRPVRPADPAPGDRRAARRRPRSGRRFVEWVRGVLELGLQDPELRLKYREKIIALLLRRGGGPPAARRATTSSPTCWPRRSTASRCRSTTWSAPATCCWWPASTPPGRRSARPCGTSPPTPTTAAAWSRTRH